MVLLRSCSELFHCILITLFCLSLLMIFSPFPVSSSENSINRSPFEQLCLTYKSSKLFPFHVRTAYPHIILCDLQMLNKKRPWVHWFTFGLWLGWDLLEDLCVTVINVIYLFIYFLKYMKFVMYNSRQSFPSLFKIK